MTLLLGLPIQEFSFLHFFKIINSPVPMCVFWGGVESFGILPTLLVTPIFFLDVAVLGKGWGCGILPPLLYHWQVAVTPNIWVGLDATLSAQIRFSRCVFSRNGNGVRVRVCMMRDSQASL